MSKAFKFRLIAATPMIALLIFLYIGFTQDEWLKASSAFLLIPVIPVILGVQKFTLSISSVVVVAYLILGFGFNLWHPGWIIFLLIPIISILFPPKRVVTVYTKTNYRNSIDADKE